MQDQLNVTKQRKRKQFPHIDLVIIIQLTCNTHTV
jgi:hypothetical protein